VGGTRRGYSPPTYILPLDGGGNRMGVKRTGQEIKVNILRLDEHNNRGLLEKTEKILHNGGVAVVPTDTVYGLVCDGLNEEAKKKIFKIKGRSEEKPLIGFVDTIKKVQRFAEIPEEKVPLIKRDWPGKKTFVLKSKETISYMTAGTGTIAFRIPDHIFLLKLLKRFDTLASTSANISGQKAPSSIEEIPDKLKEKVDIVIDGGITPGIPSSIIDLTGKDPIRLR
jgi:L-threonylcarbamoyladenylate synthase